MMFTEQERAVFAYARDGVPVHADPLELQRRLTIALGGTPDDVAKAATDEANPVGAAVAQDKLVAACRDVFAMPALDPATGRGILESEVLRVYLSFLEHLAGQKKTAATSPTSSTPTGPASSPAADSPTPSGSA